MQKRNANEPLKKEDNIPNNCNIKSKGRKRKNGNNLNSTPDDKVRKLNFENRFKHEFAENFLAKWGVKFPDDFYDFYYFTQQNPENDIDAVGLAFTGPYDVLTEKIKKETELTKVELYMHGRFYYDLPEIITLLYSKDDNGFHIGYFRDAPDDVPQILVSNQSKMNGNLSICGDNIFAAVYGYSKKLLSKETRLTKSVNVFIKQLELFAKDHGYSLAATSQKINERKKKVKAICLNKIGLVIPVDKNGVGYRELPCSEKELKKLLQKITNAENDDSKNEAFDELQEIITLVQFANDECDYGMGYELGVNLFSHGDESLNRIVLHLLPLAYRLMGYELYSDILEKHLTDRKKDVSRSIITNV
ncbi:histone PARylation factor 1 isoform X2 [Hydra vulgaris]|uniref:Histone PARylation factor 1 isoform X2 n=1 Tax=Hydra vulgaris TaxID=6087 RepID=A0ABM4CZH9_HYDVU